MTVKVLKEIIKNIPEKYDDLPILITTEDNNLEELNIILDQHKFYAQYLKDEDYYQFLI